MQKLVESIYNYFNVNNSKKSSVNFLCNFIDSIEKTQTQNNLHLRLNARITSDTNLLIFRSTVTNPSYCTEIREKHSKIFRLKILEGNRNI